MQENCNRKWKIDLLNNIYFLQRNISLFPGPNRKKYNMIYVRKVYFLRWNNDYENLCKTWWKTMIFCCFLESFPGNPCISIILNHSKNQPSVNKLPHNLHPLKVLSICNLCICINWVCNLINNTLKHIENASYESSHPNVFN
jgi:hypothetical protein